MTGFAPLLLFGLITAALAYRKGYNPLCWFFAAGVLGLIVLAFRPFTDKGEISDQERVALKRKGNLIGIILSAFGLLLGILIKMI